MSELGLKHLSKRSQPLFPCLISPGVSVRLQKYHWKFSDNFFNKAFRSCPNRASSSLIALDLSPCLIEFLAAFAFPTALFGPVDRSHGRCW